MIHTNLDDFIFESFGSLSVTKELTKLIIEKINQSIGKLILIKNLVLKNDLSNFNKIHFVNDLIIVKLTNRTYGNIDPNIKISGDTISNLYMNLEIQLSPTEIKMKEIDKNNDISDVISHELHHIIELYLTVVNSDKKSESWRYGEDLQKLQKKYQKSLRWLNISHIIYLSLPHEFQSRVEEIHNIMNRKNIKGIVNCTNFMM